MRWPWVSRGAYNEKLKRIEMLLKTVDKMADRIENSIAKTIVEDREKLRNELDDALKGRIAQQADQIAELKTMNDQLKALFDKTSAFEVVEQQSDGNTVTLRSKPPVYGGRAGWRAEAGRRSDATKPVEADSVAALEQRVAAAGGKT